MKNLTYIILTFLFGIIIGFMTFQMYINNPIPDGLADKYKVCPKCEPCPEPFKCDIEIKNPVNVMLDCNPHLKTIKALNFRISDLKSCISKECLNFSSMPSKCN